ncbi:MAG: ATP-binding protein [Acidobacteriota bacterium]
MTLSIEQLRFKQWELAVDSIDDLLILLDRHGRVVRANRAVERWKLASIIEIPGMAIHQLLHGSCRDTGCYLPALDLTANRRFETELRDPTLGRWLHVDFEPLPEASWFEGLPDALRPRALLAVRDVTEIRHQRIREGRRTRFEALHTVARNLAHQIGNPLAAMRTTTEVLAENFSRFGADKVETYLERILVGTERLQAIVERTLSDQEFTELRLEPIALGTLLSRLYGLFIDEVAARSLRFEMLPPPSPDLAALADLTAAEEVLINVLRNALEATSAGGSIMLTSLLRPQRVAVVVQDTGRGMDRRQITNLFQPFFTSKPEGHGIGLAYSSYLMRRMDGTIEIESQLGEGTTVTIEFPRAEVQP